MHTRRFLAHVAAVGALVLPTGCSSSGAGRAGPADRAASVSEASALAVVGGWGVLASDEEERALFVFPEDDRGRLRRARLSKGTPKLADIEALAVWNGGVLALCSQSRTKSKNEEKEKRGRLAWIALDTQTGKVESVVVVSGFRARILEHLVRDAGHLIADAGALEREGPTRGGLNVEGAAALGGTLLIGLRSPLSASGDALVLTLENVDEVLAGAAPRFGPVQTVRGRPGSGIRAMCADGERVLLVLGASGGGGEEPSAIGTWAPGDAAVRLLEVAEPLDPQTEGIALDSRRGLLAVVDRKKADGAPVRELEIVERPVR